MARIHARSRGRKVVGEEVVLTRFAAAAAAAAAAASRSRSRNVELATAAARDDGARRIFSDAMRTGRMRKTHAQEHGVGLLRRISRPHLSPDARPRMDDSVI